MAGTLDLVQRGLIGLETRDGAPWLDPVPLPRLAEYGFSMRCQEHAGITVQVRAGDLKISAPALHRSPIDIRLPTGTVSLAPGKPARCRCTTGDVCPSASPGGQWRPGPFGGAQGPTAPAALPHGRGKVGTSRKRPINWRLECPVP